MTQDKSKLALAATSFFILRFPFFMAPAAHAQSAAAGGAEGFRTASPEILPAGWASTYNVPRTDWAGDYDRDLLENWAEARLGTIPYSNDMATVAQNALAIGALDWLPAKWKAANGFPRVSGANSPCHAFRDLDGDGWDNWSEYVAETDPRDATDFPRPALKATLHCRSDLPAGWLVIHAYTDAEMNGWPDAVLAKEIPGGGGVAVVELSGDDRFFGHLRQGKNWFFAWIETDGSRLDMVNNGNWPTWTPGEHAAVADYQAPGGVEIGWDRNDVEFHLAEEALGYVRYSLQKPSSGSTVITDYAKDGRDHFVNIRLSGVEEEDSELNKTLKWPRVWIHEGDLQAGRTLGYGVKFAYLQEIPGTPNVYSVRVGANVGGGLVTNWYTKTLSAPTLVSPKDGEVVYAARPEFKFVLPEETTEFQFDLYKDGVIWYGARVPAPAGNEGGVTVFSPDLTNFVGDASAAYSWAVQPFNAANSSGGGWSASAYFGTADADEQAANPSCGRVALSVSRPVGGSGPVVVEAFGSHSLQGNRLASIRLGTPGGAILGGLDPRSPVWLSAYVDANANRTFDDGEPRGFFGGRVPEPVWPETGSTLQTREIVILDPP